MNRNAKVVGHFEYRITDPSHTEMSSSGTGNDGALALIISDGEPHSLSTGSSNSRGALKNIFHLPIIGHSITITEAFGRHENSGQSLESSSPAREGASLIVSVLDDSDCLLGKAKKTETGRHLPFIWRYPQLQTPQTVSPLREGSMSPRWSSMEEFKVKAHFL